MMKLNLVEIKVEWIQWNQFRQKRGNTECTYPPFIHAIKWLIPFSINS